MRRIECFTLVFPSQSLVLFLKGGGMSKKTRLLIVDDDKEDRQFIKDLLCDLQPGFEIDEANSSDSALSKLKENLYDCVLIDYIIPKLTGLAVLEATRALGKNVPFILITGFGDMKFGEELISRGAADYITKDTLTLENLQTKINAVLKLA